MSVTADSIGTFSGVIPSAASALTNGTALGRTTETEPGFFSLTCAAMGA